MDEQPGLSDQYRMSSPWPLIVVIGFVLSELGVFLGVLPVAVGGLLLLAGSVAAIVQESGYAERPWRILLGLGGVLVLLGAALVATQVESVGIDPVVATITDTFRNGIVARGVSITFAGVIVVVAGAVGQLLERELI